MVLAWDATTSLIIPTRLVQLGLFSVGIVAFLFLQMLFLYHVFQLL